MGKRVGVVAIIIEDKESIPMVNRILSKYAEIIIGRMGVPYKEKNLNIISAIIDGTTDEIGGLTGQLGKLQGVAVKSALSKN